RPRGRRRRSTADGGDRVPTPVPEEAAERVADVLGRGAGHGPEPGQAERLRRVVGPSRPRAGPRPAPGTRQIPAHDCPPPSADAGFRGGGRGCDAGPPWVNRPGGRGTGGADVDTLPRGG